MRNWKNKLFLDAMPGRYAPLDNWITEITENRIDVVVCLASDAEIRKKSPDYAALRENKQTDADQIILPVAERRVILMDLPIEDFATPAAHDVEPFWLLAAEVAHRIDEGFRVFVHCGAGIGRTGMLAVAVLMMAGKTLGESMEEISRAGSGPETEEQKSLLEAGVPGGFTEPPKGSRYPEEYLTAAHEHVTHNREEILRSATCTCFYCGYRFDPRSGEESLIWTDTDPDRKTAPTLLCPMCGIDCVIGDASGYPVTDPEFVRAFTRRWFNGYSRIDDELPPERITWKRIEVE